jgi:hypothetical protein
LLIRSSEDLLDDDPAEAVADKRYRPLKKSCFVEQKLKGIRRLIKERA